MRAWINLAALAAVLLVRGCGGCSGRSSSVAVRQPSLAGTAACGSLATCYSPAQIRVAYGIQPLADRGIDGRGQTVVLPELAQQRLSPGVGAMAVSNISQDLAGFDKLFHLPAPGFQVTTAFAPGASRWLASGEEMLGRGDGPRYRPGCIHPRAAVQCLGRVHP